jgi:hypothetical protein
MPHAFIPVVLTASSGLFAYTAASGQATSTDSPVYVAIAGLAAAIGAMWAFLVSQQSKDREERQRREDRENARYEREQARNDEFLKVLMSLKSALSSRPCLMDDSDEIPTHRHKE